MMDNIKHRVLAFLGLLPFTLILVPSFAFASTATSVKSPYLYNFNSRGTLKETGSDSETSSPYWWLNSGAYMYIDGSRGETVQGSLPATDPYRLLYAAGDSVDTDGGYHPQNIFRLVTRTKWGDARQEAYFVIKANNLSSSDQRYESNGLLLFNRYQDSQNLYYTGVRVDGSVVIKKKINSTYYTMKQVFGIYPGTYNHNTNPNLLPMNKWIGVRSEVVNLSGGQVKIDVYIDKGWSGNWVLAAEAVDDGHSYGGAAFTSPGYGGIRTDFMDVQFENYRLQSI